MVSAVCGGGLARGGGAGPPSCCILRRYAISLSMTAAPHRLGRRLVAAATWSALPPTVEARSARNDLDTIELRHAVRPTQNCASRDFDEALTKHSLPTPREARGHYAFTEFAWRQTDS